MDLLHGNIFGYFFILQAIMRSHCEWDERRDKVIYPKYYKYLADWIEQKLPQGLFTLTLRILTPKKFKKEL